MPLIYSAGPDGDYGLGYDTIAPADPYAWPNDTYEQVWGTPDASDGHYDNIHNHRIEMN